jgi:hypothetical protein
MGPQVSELFGFFYNYQPATQSFSYIAAGATAANPTAGANIMRNDGGDPDYNNIEPKETWADFNGDGKLDLFLSRGSAINADGTFQANQSSDESRIFYNNGAGNLNTDPGTYTRFGDTLSGVLSFAIDWNMDGKMDVAEMPINQGGAAVNVGYGGANEQAAPSQLSYSQITLWQNTGVTGGMANFDQKVLGSQTDVIGAMAADINWDGSQDLIMMTETKAQVLLNPNVAADGTSLHIRIVDQNGVNVFYGNTINLYDSHGTLVSTQEINPQASTTDSSGLVNFYGLDPTETYSVQLLRVTNGTKNFTGDGHNYGGYTETTVNANWGGLVPGQANAAYILTAESTSASNQADLVGTGYDDVFFFNAGNDTFNGTGGWTKDTGNGSVWVAQGGQDYVDFRAATTAVSANLTTGVATSGATTDTLTNIEGLRGSQFADQFTSSSVADSFFDGRGGNDAYTQLTTNYHTTLVYTLLDPADPTGGNGSDTMTGFHLGNITTDPGATLIDLSQLFANTANLPVLAGYVDSDGVFKLNYETDPNGPAAGGISDFLHVTYDGTNTVISVDLDGSGNTFGTLLTLNGVDTSLEQLVQNGQIVIGNGAAGISATSAAIAPFSAELAAPGTDGTPLGSTLTPNDHFFSAPGNDTFTGSAGLINDPASPVLTWSDTGAMNIVDYSQETAPIVANLLTGTATGAGADTLINIHGLIGGSGDDVFTDSTGNDMFQGGAGNDTFNLGNGGHDVLMYKALNPADPTGGNGTDQVNGFHLGNLLTDKNAAVVDLSALFKDAGGNDPVSSSNIGNYVQTTAVGNNTAVQVDLTGTGTHFTTILTMNGVHTDLNTLLAYHQIVV